MAEPTYEIVFRGKLSRDADPAAVKTRLMALFKADATRIDALLAAPKAVLKRGLPRAQAQAMHDALRQAGLVVAMVSEGGAAVSAATQAAQAEAPAPVVAASSAIAVAPAAAQWSALAEREARPDDAPAPPITFEIVENLADAIMLPPGALLAEPVIVPRPEIPDSHLSLAEPGVQIIVAPKVEKPEIADGGFDLDADGASIDQAPVVPIVELPDFDFTLADPGAVIVEVVDKPVPPVFDLSGLALEPIDEPAAEAPSALTMAMLDSAAKL